MSNLSRRLHNKLCNRYEAVARVRAMIAPAGRIRRSVERVWWMNAHDVPAFGALLRRHRQAAGLTQEEVAEEERLMHPISAAEAVQMLLSRYRSSRRHASIRLPDLHRLLHGV
jgi:hypothetical protein